MNKTVLICLLALSLANCRTIKRLEQSDKQEAHSEQRASLHRDSIYIERKDSIFILIKGDSVFIDRWHLLYKYRDVIRCDTFIKRDSVRVDVYIRETEELSKWQIFWMQFGKIAAGLLVLLILFFAFRRSK